MVFGFVLKDISMGIIPVYPLGTTAPRGYTQEIINRERHNVTKVIHGVTVQKSLDLNGSTSTPWFKKDGRSHSWFTLGRIYDCEPQEPNRPRGTERRTPRGYTLASSYLHYT